MRKKNPNDATSAVRIIDLSKLEQRQFKNDFALTKNKLIFNLPRFLLTYKVGKKRGKSKTSSFFAKVEYFLYHLSFLVNISIHKKIF